MKWVRCSDSEPNLDEEMLFITYMPDHDVQYGLCEYSNGMFYELQTGEVYDGEDVEAYFPIWRY